MEMPTRIRQRGLQSEGVCCFDSRGGCKYCICSQIFTLAPSAGKLSRVAVSQGCNHVTVAGLQGNQSGCRCAIVGRQGRLVEDKRECLQAFEGMCIAKRNRGLNSSFSGRKISHVEGVERVFHSCSLSVADLKVMRRRDVCRSKLCHLRGATKKAARIKKKVKWLS